MSKAMVYSVTEKNTHANFIRHTFEAVKRSLEMSRILVIAPPSEAESLTLFLQAEDFHVEVFDNCPLLLERVQSGDFAMVLIDAGSSGESGISGIELLRKIRQRSLLPVLIISNSQSEAEKVLALELGADDYLHKPYLSQELIARVRAIMRRTAASVSGFSHLLRVGNLELDRLKRKVKRDDQEITLTAAEFDLLDLLLKRVGRAVTREEIAQVILGRPLNHNDRSIDMHVSNLRRKLGNGEDGKGRIKAIRGIGYSFTIG
jgi:two-component system response regulator CpxR